MRENWGCYGAAIGTLKTHIPPIRFDSLNFAHAFALQSYTKFERERGRVDSEEQEVPPRFPSFSRTVLSMSNYSSKKRQLLCNILILTGNNLLYSVLTPFFQTPNKEFVIFKRENIRRTYHQLLKDVSLREFLRWRVFFCSLQPVNTSTFQAERLACGLIHLGVEKGDRVGIWGPNTYEWVTAQFATALGGMVLVSTPFFGQCVLLG